MVNEGRNIVSRRTQTSGACCMNTYHSAVVKRSKLATTDRLVGLVVKASDSRVQDPGFESYQ